MGHLILEEGPLGHVWYILKIISPHHCIAQKIKSKNRHECTEEHQDPHLLDVMCLRPKIKNHMFNQTSFT